MGQMGFNRRIRKFLLPPLTLTFLIRVSLVTLSAYLIFGHLLIPFRVKGISMEPTYRDGGFHLCWRLRYLFSEPRRGDVVVVRLAGKSVLLLKRVVALGGEEVEFRQGKLLVNGKAIHEPYVFYPCNWNLSPRQVEPKSVYLVGDNRNGPVENHLFGQTPMNRIIGVPLW